MITNVKLKCYNLVISNHTNEYDILASYINIHRAPLVAQTVKNLPAIWETWIRFLSKEGPLEKEMASHSIILFFKLLFIFISWRLITLQYCSGFCHTLTWISHGFTRIHHPDPPFHIPLYPIRLIIPWREEPGSLQPMVSQRVKHDWETFIWLHINILITTLLIT